MASDPSGAPAVLLMRNMALPQGVLGHLLGALQKNTFYTVPDKRDETVRSYTEDDFKPNI